MANNEKIFSKEYTNCVKGIAVLLLFVHHVLNTLYPYQTILIGKDYDYMSYLVSLSKVCVYLFFMMSGYGMFISFSKIHHSLIDICKFVLRHIIKLWSIFWIIYIIFVPMGILFGRSPSIVYNGEWTNMAYDFLGLAYITSHTSCIPTWWYLSMSILFYIFFPVLYYIIKILNKWSILAWVIAALFAVKYIGWKVSLIYCIPFILGSLLAHFEGLEKIRIIIKNIIKMKSVRFLIYLALILAYCVFRLQIMSKDMFYYRLDWIPALLIVCTVYDLVPIRSKCAATLKALGQNSGNIYLFHAFIYSLYFKKIIYSFHYAPLVYIASLLICLFISEGLEYIKTISGYNKLFSYINLKLS